MLILCIAPIAKSQIKIHNDGHISLMSSTKSKGVQIKPNGYTYFDTYLDNEWHWVTLAYTNNNLAKCWIVANPLKQHTFFVTGIGHVFKKGTLTLSDANLQAEQEEIVDATTVLDQITGFYYTFSDDSKNTADNKGNEIKRNVGFSAQEIEKILPEAVMTDSEGLKYVNYEILTTFLVEGFKEQQKEIELLRKTLEEHGLLKPYK